MSQVTPHPDPRERAVVFGEHRGLVGVLTEPTRAREGARRAVVVANVGTHHHVGPYRLWVDLARALAPHGVATLRFDLAGLGDSAPYPADVVGAQDADPGRRDARDVRAAMDWLAAHVGVTEFVLVALCSGVDGAHAAALDDPRVVGVAFIDGHAYRTPGFYVRRHTVRYAQAARWAGWARRTARRFTVPAPPAAGSGDAAVFARKPPTLAAFRRDMATLARRGVRLLFVYTGTVDGRFNAASQLAEMLGRGPARGRAEVMYCPEADHVFSGVAHRAALVARLVAWAAGDTGTPGRA